MGIQPPATVAVPLASSRASRVQLRYSSTCFELGERRNGVCSNGKFGRRSGWEETTVVVQHRATRYGRTIQCCWWRWWVRRRTIKHERSSIFSPFGLFTECVRFLLLGSSFVANKVHVDSFECTNTFCVATITAISAYTRISLLSYLAIDILFVFSFCRNQRMCKVTVQTYHYPRLVESPLVYKSSKAESLPFLLVRRIGSSKGQGIHEFFCPGARLSRRSQIELDR